VVRQVPAGEVISYGEVARLCGTIPVLVGKALADCPADVPWHRVIGAGGEIRLERRGAEYAAEQRSRLAAEGVAFLADGRVDLSVTPPDERAPDRR
jgi:methylated-DNA-protein-cysteine methyltransferase-like protein